MGRYEEALEHGSPKYSDCAFGNQAMDPELVNARQAFVYARMGKAEEARKILRGRESISGPGEFFSRAFLAAPTARWAIRIEPSGRWKKPMKRGTRAWPI
jgi:hypothetical protein